MCFVIDFTAERPINKVAYKIVQLTSAGYLRSTHFFRGSDTYWSTPGATVHRSTGPTHRSGFWGIEPCSSHGIYVYRTLASARRALRDFHDEPAVILKVLIDPADWIQSSYLPPRQLAIATYDKVTVAENQPYLDWY